MPAAALFEPTPDRWLRWQLTRRGGLLWHECCATCANAVELDLNDPEPNGCCPAQPARYISPDDACSEYWPKED